MRDFYLRDVSGKMLAISFVVIPRFLDDQWRHDRRFMNQFFNPKMITSYMSSLTICVNLLIAEVGKFQSSGEEVVLLTLLEKCALQAVCSTLFGMDVTDKRIDDICVRTSEIFDT